VRNLTEPSRGELDLKPGDSTDGRAEDDEEIQGEICKTGERKHVYTHIIYKEYINTNSCIKIPGLIQVCPIFKPS
jgi:hypothetical protein